MMFWLIACLEDISRINGSDPATTLQVALQTA